jgi:uncharacterized protein (DUF488 family)
MTIYTIGHSTRSLEEFLSLLRAHGITRLGDVRTVPKSRRHPHFAGEALAMSLESAGIAYRHLPALGGLRKPRRDSKNSAWRHEGFRGYADYMESSEFENAISDLIAWADAAESRTVIMCAEAVWWRCHRQLVADALVARNVSVQHIQTATSAPEHKLTEFARINGIRVGYPSLV